MLDYRIDTFLTLCKERNYSKTAQKLCITQPAVTQHIQYLERFYGTKLFVYENKQLLLTPQGRILEKMALGLSVSNKRVYELIQETKHHKKHLKIGASLTLSECILPAIIKELLTICPDLKISMYVDSTERLFDGLDNGLFECLFVEGSLHKEKYDHYLFSYEDYIAISGTPLECSNLEDLLSYPIICREENSGPRKLLDDVLLTQHITVDSFANCVEMNNLTVIKELVKQNVGIGFSYKAGVLNELQEQSLYEIPLDLNVKREFNFVLLKNNIFSHHYLSLYHFAKEIYEENNVESKKDTKPIA